MKTPIALYIFLVLLIFQSCSPSRPKMIENISKMESEMKAAQVVDTNKVAEMLGAYQAFASKFKDDSLAPEYLYKAAGLAVGFNRGNQAIELYERIVQTYPNFKKVPECYFMEAFAYENSIGNIAKANEYYNMFLAKFPEHELADDAQSALKFLGKTPEEMVREFEKMNADSAAVTIK